jgi:hypothetical protein
MDVLDTKISKVNGGDGVATYALIAGIGFACAHIAKTLFDSGSSPSKSLKNEHDTLMQYVKAAGILTQEMEVERHGKH